MQMLEPDPALCEAFRLQFGTTAPPWDRASPFFQSPEQYHRALRKAIYFRMQVIRPLEIQGLQRSDAILDLASGDGEMSLALRWAGFPNLTLHDLDSERLSRARGLVTVLGGGGEPAVVHGDARELGEGHDVLVCVQTIEHLSDRGNYSVASRSCQRAFLDRVNLRVRKLAYFHAPNFWYPIDGHDTGKPFFHFLPMRAKEAIIARGLVKSSWAGICAPVSVGFLSRHLPNFRLLTRYYAFADALEYLQNRAPYDYMCSPCPPVDVGNLSWKRKVVVRASRLLGYRSHNLLSSLSVIFGRREALPAQG